MAYIGPGSFVSSPLQEEGDGGDVAIKGSTMQSGASRLHVTVYYITQTY